MPIGQITFAKGEYEHFKAAVQYLQLYDCLNDLNYKLLNILDRGDTKSEDYLQAVDDIHEMLHKIMSNHDISLSGEL